MDRSILESNISVNVSRSKKIDRFEAKEDGSLRKFIIFFVFYEENHCCGSIARTVCVIHAIRESEVTRTKKRKNRFLGIPARFPILETWEILNLMNPCENGLGKMNLNENERREGWREEKWKSMVFLSSFLFFSFLLERKIYEWLTPPLTTLPSFPSFTNYFFVTVQLLPIYLSLSLSNSK